MVFKKKVEEMKEKNKFVANKPVAGKTTKFPIKEEGNMACGKKKGKKVPKK